MVPIFADYLLLMCVYVCVCEMIHNWNCHNAERLNHLLSVQLPPTTIDKTKVNTYFSAVCFVLFNSIAYALASRTLVITIQKCKHMNWHLNRR